MFGPLRDPAIGDFRNGELLVRGDRIEAQSLWYEYKQRKAAEGKRRN